MNKTIWTILIGAMLTPLDSDTPKYEPNEVKQEISKVLSLDELEDKQESISYKDQEYIRQEAQSPNQQRINKLISQIKEPIIIWDMNQPNVAITIDDGYGKESIEYILNIFEKNNIKATFFVIWECLKLHPTLWRKAAQQWHEICNHTQTHSKYFKTWNEPERFEMELLWWEKTVKEVLWENYLIKMKNNHPFFRFPWMYWIREKAYLDILKKHGYIPIWRRHTENPKDWVVNNWDIFLRHFKNQDTLNIKKNLELILKNGKQAKTVSDIIMSEEYTEPIWWHNVYKKRSESKTKKH